MRNQQPNVFEAIMSAWKSTPSTERPAFGLHINCYLATRNSEPQIQLSWRNTRAQLSGRTYYGYLATMPESQWLKAMTAVLQLMADLRSAKERTRSNAGRKDSMHRVCEFSDSARVAS